MYVFTVYTTAILKEDEKKPIYTSTHLQNYTAVFTAWQGLMLYFDYNVYYNMPVDSDRNKPDGFSNVYFCATSICTAEWGLMHTAQLGFNALNWPS